ncbi:hypothetical protein C8N36_1451 [Pelagimonas varians]|uniref:Uncharacterized protein n=1 Tax=Pelagimonas varians TaxID=696760 RepID=A0A238L8T4_9RHOB|nr:hypothetical protein C8N36_1451 [Pelagimonas varians]SMX50726.1 hypothetical protein PEV8663_04781 [Pelagimonas varians]
MGNIYVEYLPAYPLGVMRTSADTQGGGGGFRFASSAAPNKPNL